MVDDKSNPIMKYYAFDWDDNLMFMPTKIYLKDKNGNSVGMSTEDFAEHRTEIGVVPFNYNNITIVDFDDNPFRDFKVAGDKNFLRDSMVAQTGPAWFDFVEAINNGSVFAIITARGHTPIILKEAVYRLIKLNKHGLNSSKLIRNLKKYRELADEVLLSNDELIRSYLDAMETFVRYIKLLSHRLQKKAFMKNKISNYFTPNIGFSDDDIRNVEKMKTHFDKKKNNILQTYLTSGGNKIKY